MDELGPPFPLHHAVIGLNTPNLDNIRRIIAQGTDVNSIIPGASDSVFKHCTPLHFAADGRHQSAVQLFLDHGADASRKNAMGQTPLHWALGRPDGEEKNATRKALIELLLQNGANINQPDNDGCTPFHYAMLTGNPEIVVFLLNRGADIRATTGRGKTALHLAAGNRCENVIDIILGHGFDINCRCNEDFTPLHDSVSSGNVQRCELLLKRGANVNCRSCHTDETPLTVIAQARNTDCRIVEMLLQYGANMNDMIRDRSILEIAATMRPRISCRNSELSKLALVSQVALMRFQNIAVNEGNRKMIKNDPEYKHDYERCTRELKNMAEDKFYYNLSVFDILTGPKNVLSGYARNEELVKALEESNDKFPIYSRALQRKFFNEVNRQRLRRTSAEILTNVFCLYDPFHPVIRKILYHLEDEDLLILRT